ncbi:phosphoserine phosphatase SerB [Erythrobacter sp.]|uniref:phosphoserine phosphatase SerB n=1 Tax=Erythrobacter sp. TaxID=1042 RepID=UPI002EBA88A4|nr:phosphoserine phosphatase SerB [Erythrobacter sp.]
MLIARLIADHFSEGTGDLDTRLDAASAALEADGMPLASAMMLDVGLPVLEMRFAEGQALKVLAAIDRFFAPADALVGEGEIAVPHLFVSDMDSTMIGQECIDELADFADLKPQIAVITERAMRGEIDFEAALRERVGLLAGLEESAIDRCLAERISPSPGARILVATLAAHGCRSVLVTGGFHHFADRVGEQLGFDRVVGNRLGVEEGRLTGGLVGAISDGRTKRAVLEKERVRLGSGARVLAAGDGANDIPMLQAADYAIAYRAKPQAREAANGRVERGDLTGVLALLGIPRRDWVGA